MANVVEICNLALSHIGAYRISALTDRTKEARQCKTLYEYTRDSVLEDHNWSFAKTEQTLALLSDTYSGWDYAYAYPSDCIAPREIFDDTGITTGTSYDVDTGTYVQTGKVEYEVRINENRDQNIILTNKEDAILIYTVRIENTTLFSPLFVDAFSFRLASDLVIPMKADKNLKQQMFQEYHLRIGKAKANNSNIEYKKPDNVNTFTRARN